MDEARRQTSVERVIAGIERAISSGELVPGQRLVEADLTERLGASRGAVRSALQYLAGDGVVELLPNRGARIRKFGAERLREIMEVLVSGIIRTAMELFVRQPLEPEIAEQLNNRLLEIEAAARSRDVQLLSDRMALYNEFVCHACGNAYIRDLLRKVHLRHYARQFVTEDDLEDFLLSAVGYRQMTEYLLKGNADDAYRVLRKHMNHTLERYQRNGKLG